MACRCVCCEKTGACCVGESCEEVSCAACEDLGGVFQGVGTSCTEEETCPCDPPADPDLCQKCVDGEAESFCPEDKPYCCEGVCQAEPCEDCSGPCDDSEDCAPGCECVDGECVEGGACCECEDVELVPDQQGGFNTEAGAQDEVDAREAFLAAFQALAADNGYICLQKVVVNYDGQAPNDEGSYVYCPDDPPYPEAPCLATFAGLNGRCCGTLSEETVSLTEEGPFGQTFSIPICVPDETTRTCADGLTEAQCDERCGEFHVGETCAEEPCNPLP